MSADVSVSAGADGHLNGYGSRPYRSYVLTALLFIYILNFVDRGLLAVVGPVLKPELGVSDTVWGLLTGAGFAIVYTLIGIPLARIAEVKHRVWIMTICVAIWSIMTALCGLSREFVIGGTVVGLFWVILACRIGVAVGEAGCTPPATSLISDYYPQSRRSTALGYYAMGVTLGTVLANLIGGPVAQHYGWRMAFIVVGLPGVLVAIALKLTVKEPPRGYTDPPGTAKVGRSNFADALKILFSKKSYWAMIAGTTLASFCGYGITNFQSLFLQRTFDIQVKDASLFVNAPVALASAIGTVLTGWLAERMLKRHPTAVAWIPGVGLILSVGFYVMAFTTDVKEACVFGLIMGGFVKYGYLAAQYTIAQGVVGVRVRATATAVLIFMQNMIGYTFGPLFIGAVSDALFHRKITALGMGGDLIRESCEKKDLLAALTEAQKHVCSIAHPEALQDSMLITACIYAVSGSFLILSCRWLKEDMTAK
ncbi:MFS transporter [soil metagenome]